MLRLRKKALTHHTNGHLRDCSSSSNLIFQRDLITSTTASSSASQLAPVWDSSILSSLSWKTIHANNYNSTHSKSGTGPYWPFLGREGAYRSSHLQIPGGQKMACAAKYIYTSVTCIAYGDRNHKLWTQLHVIQKHISFMYQSWKTMLTMLPLFSIITLWKRA